MIHGNATTGFDRAFAVAVDPAGDAVAVGTTENIGTGGDFTVVKLAAADGSERWSQLVNGSLNSHDDRALAVAVDPGGDVVAAGELVNIGTARDFAVAKLAKETGAVLWRHEISGSLPGSVDRGITVAVDPAGDVVGAGLLQNLDTGNDFAVVKFDSMTGTEQWRTVIDGADSDQARAVALDQERNVVAAGWLGDVVSGFVSTVVKLSGVDGTELWRTQLNGSAAQFGFVLDAAVDPSGDVVAVGEIGNRDTSVDFTVAKLAGSDGRELWRREIHGNFPDSIDRALAVTVDQGNHVVAAGYINGVANGPGADFFVTRLHGETGEEIWRQVISGTTNGTSATDSAEAVAIDAAGDVVAAGYIDDSAANTQFSVVKFAGADGRELWRRMIGGNSDEQAHAVAIDEQGDVLAAGITPTVNGLFDFTVLKAAGDDGHELWRRDIDGTGNNNDRAYAVAVDDAGDVVVAGFTFTAEAGTARSGADFTVVKLSGADGSSPGEPTPTPTTVQSPTSTATRTPTRIPLCQGDCGGNGEVSISELVTGVRIALEMVAAAACPAFDANRDGRVKVKELVQAVRHALKGCPT